MCGWQGEASGVDFVMMMMMMMMMMIAMVVIMVVMITTTRQEDEIDITIVITMIVLVISGGSDYHTRLLLSWPRYAQVSEWIEPDSDVSSIRIKAERVLKQELAWATHLTVPAVLLPPTGTKIANYSRLLNQVSGSWLPPI